MLELQHSLVLPQAPRPQDKFLQLFYLTLSHFLRP